MPSIRQISQTLEEDTALKLVAQAYSEIAALKLQRIRSDIEKNRTFFEEILGVLHTIKTVAIERNIPTPAKKGTVSVLLTSNFRFYGTIEKQLIEFFIIQSTKRKTDKIVVGKSALSFLKALGYSSSYDTDILAGDIPTQTELKRLSSKISGYNQILVYYPRFQSVLTQKPFAVDISQSSSAAPVNQPLHKIDYILEPEIHQMLAFFDRQITGLLLETAFLDAELARTAARLISMDEAQTNADDLIKKERRTLLAAKREIENTRLIEAAAALINWRKGAYAT